MRGRRLVVMGLVATLFVACHDGDGGAPPTEPMVAVSLTTAPASPVAGLPCEVPGDIRSYRRVWDMKMDSPGPEVEPEDDQLSSLLKELEGQDIPPEDLGEVFYVIFLTSFENGRAPVRISGRGLPGGG
jgi:hypothetical protein